MAAILFSVASGRRESLDAVTILIIAAGFSKTDWPGEARPADRNRNRIVTLGRSWYRLRRPADGPRGLAGAWTHKGSPLRDAPDYEKLRSPRAVRLALSRALRP